MRHTPRISITLETADVQPSYIRMPQYSKPDQKGQEINAVHYLSASDLSTVGPVQ